VAAPWREASDLHHASSAEAEHYYASNLDVLKQEVESSLAPETVRELDPLDRPVFVESLRDRLEVRLRDSEKRRADAEQQAQDLAQELAASMRENRKLGSQLRGAESAKRRKAAKAARLSAKRKRPKGRR
jgi:hypothetical protein